MTKFILILHNSEGKIFYFQSRSEKRILQPSKPIDYANKNGERLPK